MRSKPSRTKRKAAFERLVKSIENFHQWRRNLGNKFSRIASKGDEWVQRQAILDGMTNWQRSQYCRAKKAGVDMPIEQMASFLALKRPA